MKYSTKCTCGNTIIVDTPSKSDAIEQLKDIMSPSRMAKHMLEKHKGEEIPTPEQVFATITQTTKAASS